MVTVLDGMVALGGGWYYGPDCSRRRLAHGVAGYANDPTTVVRSFTGNSSVGLEGSVVIGDPIPAAAGR